VPLALDWTGSTAIALYALIGAIAAALVIFEYTGRGVRLVVRELRGEPPEPPSVAVSEQISAEIELVQDEGAPHRRLGTIKPRFEIHNGSPDYAIRDVRAGVRLRGWEASKGHQFDWYVAEIAPGQRAEVASVEIPPAMFRDAHESAVAQEAFVFWARFTDASGRFWEVWRDAHTKQAGEQLDPPPLDMPR
jgi:hypothetical protein